MKMKFEQQVIDEIDKTAEKIYDEYYDLLATYQFDFDLDEKNLIIEHIMRTIQERSLAQ